MMELNQFIILLINKIKDSRKVTTTQWESQTSVRFTFYNSIINEIRDLDLDDLKFRFEEFLDQYRKHLKQ